MFRTVLIANRGEIAVRVISTLRRLGIRSVAVYSDADAGSPHVRLADTAIRIGPAAAAQSYLDIDAVIAAALRSGAEAVHPGYGFLSESARFAEACRAAGLVFIGPGTEALTTMADKIAAKARVTERGIPVIPGVDGRGLDDAALAAAAAGVGFPLLIKPAAGGGGKGMVVVDGPDGLLDSLASARRIALGSFGDDTVLLERLITRPRHIEVQVMADRHGAIVHLGERECSLQRRHQKVIEEAPSPAVDEATRQRLGAAACDVARSVGYEGAGTVEFLMSEDDPDSFFFIEMNTRLQVEHPVTEEITGLDLVELQLRVAAGEPLPLRQEDVVLRGHAIEARIYAESPERGFLPSAGTILDYHAPQEDGLRVDGFLVDGLVVSGDYDPMLAKAIAWGADREQALDRLDALLAGTSVLGVDTNIRFLRELIADPEVRAGRLTTDLIEQRGDLASPEPDDDDRILAALAVHDSIGSRITGPWGARDGWRLSGRRRATTHRLAGVDVEVVRTADADGLSSVTIAGVEHRVAVTEPDAAGLRRLRSGQRVESVRVVIDTAVPRTVWIHRAGRILELDAPTRAELGAAEGRGRDVTASGADPVARAGMPGTVVVLGVADGDQVEAGAVIGAVEAMKMEHPVLAPFSGTVELRVRIGDSVRRDQPIAVITPDDAPSGAASA